MGDTKSVIIWECFVIFLPVHRWGRRCFNLTGQSCLVVKSLRNPWTWDLYYRGEFNIQISFLFLRLANSIVSRTYIVTLKCNNYSLKYAYRRIMDTILKFIIEPSYNLWMTMKSYLVVLIGLWLNFNSIYIHVHIQG